MRLLAGLLGLRAKAAVDTSGVLCCTAVLRVLCRCRQRGSLRCGPSVQAVPPAAAAAVAQRVGRPHGAVQLAGGAPGRAHAGASAHGGWSDLWCGGWCGAGVGGAGPREGVVGRQGLGGWCWWRTGADVAGQGEKREKKPGQGTGLIWTQSVCMCRRLCYLYFRPSLGTLLSCSSMPPCLYGGTFAAPAAPHLLLLRS